MDMLGFNLLLQDFCSYCPDFKASVETIEGVMLIDGSPRAYHNIRCEYSKHCTRMMESISKRVSRDEED